ncbi:UDP-N-acetylmuramate dehydrogenase [Dongia mobilis]|uniref:UDP-N-acetylenolpyruvoylglucosamine reductase n=2 Tax=Dongia mobilis TaxID=578943 RepID=A0A4R6WR55_9PROT|nr:UDP-N-acetylmuramate dehydrogenase [Dongia mobilis]
MMSAAPRHSALIDRLPAVRGRLTEGASLAKVTWFRVGGPAEVLFKPADVADLQHFLAHCPADVKLTVLGVGSNLLVRDGGIPGVVIRLGRAFAEIRTDGLHVHAGAAALDLNVALAARAAGVAGLEFLSGIPGTIGGALRMNAGAYGSDLSQIFVSATALDRQGRLHRLDRDAMGFTYRHSAVAEDWIFCGADLAGRAGDPSLIQQRLNEIQAAREDSQPVRARTGGSTFVNPPGAKAWELIDRAGCRGLKLGGAQVSEKHCNFLLNTGTATAADLEALGETVRRRVKESSGIELAWEIKRIGVPADSPLAILARSEA